MRFAYTRYLSGDWQWVCSRCQATGLAERGSLAVQADQAHQEVCSG